MFVSARLAITCLYVKVTQKVFQKQACLCMLLRRSCSTWERAQDHLWQRIFFGDTDDTAL